MVGTLSHLYATLQRLKKLRPTNRRARWYVQDSVGGERRGPFEAVEVAYQLHVGLLGIHDWVINGDTAERYVVVDHEFLKKWITANADQRRRLASSLKRAVREWAKGQRVPVTSMRRWLKKTMSDEERRAFEVLSLEPGSSPDEVRQRHRQLALAHHPDRGGNQQRMKEINWAFDIAFKAPAVPTEARS